MKKLLLTAILLLSALPCIFMPSLLSPKLRAAGTNPTTPIQIELPIIMYHSVLKQSNGKYTIHPDKLESDIIRFKKLGYTPVTLREVSAWTEGKATLPEKPMVITFDDGHFNNLHYALPILQKHNCKAVINIITSLSKEASENPKQANNPSFSYLTDTQIKQLHESNLIEIGNHTHSLHKFKPRYGIAQIGGEPLDRYRNEITADIESANKFITDCGVPRPTTFAYPFGKYTKEGHKILCDLGFRTILTCTEGTNKITQGDAQSLLALKRYNRSGTANQDAFFKKVFKC